MASASLGSGSFQARFRLVSSLFEASVFVLRPCPPQRRLPPAGAEAAWCWRVVSVLFHTSSIQTKLLLSAHPGPPSREPPRWFLHTASPSPPTLPGAE